MAQQVIVTMTDDIDGKEAAETVTFALDGASYEIDLSEQNAAKLRKALEPFVSNGRRMGKAKGAKRPGNSKAAEVRAWAVSAGVDVPAKGRVPASVVEAWEAAKGA
jgi:hypothetical protein